MATYASSQINVKQQLRICWDTDFNWELVPTNVKEVSVDDLFNDRFNGNIFKF